MRVIVISLIWTLVHCDTEIWEQDMSQDVYIEGTGEGFQNVLLNCHDESMEVIVHMDEKFDGIFYTRGSYQMGKLPCFFDATGNTEISLNIPYDDCKTVKKDDGSYVNTVIVQHDDLLIFPGDTAFEIACNKSSQAVEKKVYATIGLADPDPAAKELPKHRKSTVKGEESVTFTPNDIRPRKKKKKEKKQKKSPRTKRVKKELRDEL